VIPLVARAAPLFMVLAGQGFVSLTSFLTVFALGRWSGESALGAFALGWSCWFLASSLADTLVATPYTYFLSQKTRTHQDLPMIALWGIVCLCLVFWFGLSLVQVANIAALAALWPALPTAISASLLREFARRHYLANGRSASLVLLDGLSSLAQIIGIIGLITFDKLTPNAMLWVIALSTSMPLLPMLTQSRIARFIAARSSVNAELVSFFGYGRWLLVGGACHVASVQAYPWLAFAAGGTRTAGLYAACMAIVNLLTPVLTGLTNYFRPKFMAAHVTGMADHFSSYVLRRSAIFVAPGLMMGVLLAVFGQFALATIYGDSFGEGTRALVWFGLAAVAVCAAAPLQLGLLALRATVTNFYYHATALTCLGLGVIAIHVERLTLIDLARISCAASWMATAVLLAHFFYRSRPHQDAP
jgi:O-antigen/teichoic acid export membrane protein